MIFGKNRRMTVEKVILGKKRRRVILILVSPLYGRDRAGVSGYGTLWVVTVTRNFSCEYRPPGTVVVIAALPSTFEVGTLWVMAAS